MIAALLAASLAAAADPAGAVVMAKPKLLLLDFADQGVGENAVKIVHDTLAAHLSKDNRLDVISPEDMRRVLDVEAQKRALTNCSDESCLAEIAEALGAQLTMYGTVGKLGELVVVNVSVFDTKAAKSVARETVQAKSLEELPDRVAEAGDRLIARIPGLAPALTSHALGPVAWTGAGIGVLGLATAITGGLVAVFNNPTPTDGRTFAEKESALPVRDGWAVVGGVGLGVAVVGAAVFAVGLAIE